MFFFFEFLSFDQKIKKREIYDRRNGSAKNGVSCQERNGRFAKNIPAEKVLPAKAQGLVKIIGKFLRINAEDQAADGRGDGQNQNSRPHIDGKNSSQRRQTVQAENISEKKRD